MIRRMLARRRAPGHLGSCLLVLFGVLGGVSGCQSSPAQPGSAYSAAKPVLTEVPSQSSEASPGVASCGAASIRLRPSRSTTLDGQAIDSFYIENVSPAACAVDGFPTVWLRSRTGGLIRTSERHGGTQFGDPYAARFVLKQKQGIGFNVQAAAPGSGHGCWTAMTASIALPGQRTKVSSPTESDRRGFDACGATLRVSPFYAPVFYAG